MLNVDSSMIDREVAKLNKYKEIVKDEKPKILNHAKKRWTEWLTRYESRLREEATHISKTDNQIPVKTVQELQEYRVKRMNQTNPAVVLRNYMAEEVIKKAEQGDFSAVDDLLKQLLSPYEVISEAKDSEYTKCAPEWAKGLCVSCSS